MNARELDLIIVEAQEKIEAEWAELLADWEGARAPQPTVMLPPSEEVAKEV
jgi:hypothetical protein